MRNPPLRHRTRSFPRRHQEVIDGGSMYWVISGSMLVRQRIVDIIEDQRDDGTRLHRLVLDRGWCRWPGGPTKPFQGWRYLRPERRRGIYWPIVAAAGTRRAAGGEDGPAPGAAAQN